jgi:hypothetical protein
VLYALHADHVHEHVIVMPCTCVRQRILEALRVEGGNIKVVTTGTCLATSPLLVNLLMIIAQGPTVDQPFAKGRTGAVV